MDVEATRRIAQAMLGRKVQDSAGERIGEIVAVYHDDRTLQLEWVAVRTGFFGTRTSLVPYTALTEQGDDFAVPYPKSVVRDAPDPADDGRVSPQEEAQLRRHYASHTPSPTTSDTSESETGADDRGAGAAGTVGAAASSAPAGSTAELAATSTAVAEASETGTSTATQRAAAAAVAAPSLTRRLAEDVANDVSATAASTHAGADADDLQAATVTGPSDSTDSTDPSDSSKDAETLTTSSTPGESTSNAQDSDASAPTHRTETDLANGTMTTGTASGDRAAVDDMLAVPTERADATAGSATDDFTRTAAPELTDPDVTVVGSASIDAPKVLAWGNVLRREPFVSVGASAPLSSVNENRGLVQRPDQELVLRAERVHVETERRPIGRVQLRRHVVTERKTIEVEVRREEIRMVRIPAGDDTVHEGELGETVLEYTLYEDVPVLVTAIAPTERVRIETGTVVERHTMEADQRREEVELIRQPASEL